MKRNVCLLLTLMLMAGTTHANWRIQSQMRFWLGLDDNVFESLSEAEQDETGRLAGTVSLQGHLSKKWILGLQYIGAIEGYSHYNAENRMIHAGSLVTEYVLFGSLIGGVSCNGRIKDFLKAERGYVSWECTPYFKIPIARTMIGHLGYIARGFDFQQGTYFDSRFQGMQAEVKWDASSRIKCQVRGTWGQYRYDRMTYRLSESGNPNVLGLIETGHLQKDTFREIDIGVESYGWMLLQISGGYRERQSNNYGYTSSCPFFEATVGKTLFESWSLSCRTVLQWLQYVDDLAPLLLVNPDTESEDCSVLVFDLSRQLSKSQTLGLRFGWYENESPIRNRFYRKTVFSIGYSYRF